jgi:DNA polymerase III delta subunit
MTTSKTSYSLYEEQIRPILQLDSLESVPKLIILSGASDFLRTKTIQQLTNKFTAIGQAEKVMADFLELNPQQFKTLWMQKSLFDPHLIYVIRRGDKSAKILAHLKEIKSSRAVKTWLIMELLEKPNTELRKKIQSLDGLIIECEEPSVQSEMLKIIAATALDHDLNLADDAKNLLMAACGFNLSAIDNEVTKLSLLFRRSRQIIHAKDIASHIGMIREDHVFELFTLLRSQQKSRADVLVDQLLQRQEKALAVTGIFSRFHRDQIGKGQNQSIEKLLEVAKTDQFLKTSKCDETLLLSSLIR